MKDILISLRTENRYSQNSLAKELGISRQAYIKYETGEVEPSVEIIRKLSRIFNVSYAYLIDNGTCKKEDSITDIQKALMNKIKTLPQNQLQAVYNILESIEYLNSESNGSDFHRTPGGLSGDLLMSEDFDEPLNI